MGCLLPCSVEENLRLIVCLDPSEANGRLRTRMEVCVTYGLGSTEHTIVISLQMMEGKPIKQEGAFEETR